jgi:4-amino-4-deoxy-L-arabinose transferase-like glycosyltransferase
MIFGVLLAGVVVRLAFAGLIPLFPDEAYYWEWSRRLATGYFDHPPGIPLLVRAGTALAGVSSLGVRLFPVLAGLVAGVATAGVAWRLAGDSAALRASLIITCMPLAAAGLVLATPDAPLLATTALGLYAVTRALQSPLRSRQSLGWWTAAGVALGLAFCSKYTSILMPVGVVIAVLARRGLRARLAEPGPYVACVFATLIFLPVLRWNAAHDWVSFGFQVHHGLATPARPDLFAPFKRLGDLIGGQAGLVSPILFVLMAVAVARELRRPTSDISFMLSVVAAFSFLFFCYSATRQRVEANWPAPAYIAAIPLLASMPASRRLRGWFDAGIALAVVLSVLIYLHAAFGLLPLAPRKDPLARSAGWRDLARTVAASATRTPAMHNQRWIAADRYQDAAELAFHLPSHPTTFSLNLSGRRNQYDLWPGFADTAHPGDDLVLALDESQGAHPTVSRLAPFFRSFSRDSLVELRSRHGPVGQRRVWILRDWSGRWLPR